MADNYYVFGTERYKPFQAPEDRTAEVMNAVAALRADTNMKQAQVRKDFMNSITGVLDTAVKNRSSKIDSYISSLGAREANSPEARAVVDANLAAMAKDYGGFDPEVRDKLNKNFNDRKTAAISEANQFDLYDKTNSEWQGQQNAAENTLFDKFISGMPDGVEKDAAIAEQAASNAKFALENPYAAFFSSKKQEEAAYNTQQNNYNTKDLDAKLFTLEFNEYLPQMQAYGDAMSVLNKRREEAEKETDKAKKEKAVAAIKVEEDAVKAEFKDLLEWQKTTKNKSFLHVELNKLADEAAKGELDAQVKLARIENWRKTAAASLITANAAKQNADTNEVKVAVGMQGQASAAEADTAKATLNTQLNLLGASELLKSVTSTWIDTNGKFKNTAAITTIRSITTQAGYASTKGFITKHKSVAEFLTSDEGKTITGLIRGREDGQRIFEAAGEFINNKDNQLTIGEKVAFYYALAEGRMDITPAGQVRIGGTTFKTDDFASNAGTQARKDLKKQLEAVQATRKETAKKDVADAIQVAAHMAGMTPQEYYKANKKELSKGFANFDDYVPRELRMTEEEIQRLDRLNEAYERSTQREEERAKKLGNQKRNTPDPSLKRFNGANTYTLFGYEAF